jgi:hypothetical protein
MLQIPRLEAGQVTRSVGALEIEMVGKFLALERMKILETVGKVHLTHCLLDRLNGKEKKFQVTRY